ncbi:hypothetical protein [Streptosporangium lutulentum]|uniref:Uncharacterized protein n=1 Tax=Streptosporangium lutulentum TaxID=1461250 RepID=A0ABT9Q8Z4_9ACTN|nr:hypothetical protein [Streptosporangium lutulentum]MDP9843218.1 hypothetical protein [Streptosporangium lutulentum]
MTMLLLALVVAALIAGVFLWRKPDARKVTAAAAGGAWKSGRQQAVAEFRDGYKATRAAYDRAQKTLQRRGTRRARTASFVLEVLGVTVVTAGGAVYGAAKTVGATRRIVTEATRGGRAAVKAATVVEAEIVKDSDEETDDEDIVHEPEEKPSGDAPAEPGNPRLITNTVIIATDQCQKCGAEHTVTINAGETAAEATCGCGQQLRFVRARPDGTPGTNTQAEPQAVTQPGPVEGPPSEGTTNMAAEANGLLTYAQAHAQLAGQLQALSVENNSLANSMTNTIAPHASIIATTAILQDLLNQAASIAQQIADEAAALATS